MATEKRMIIVGHPPSGATLFDITVAPVMNGGDANGINHVCGSCGLLLIENMGPAVKFHDVYIKCLGCGKYNTPSGDD